MSFQRTYFIGKWLINKVNAICVSAHLGFVFVCGRYNYLDIKMRVVYSLIYTSAVTEDLYVWTEGRSCVILIRSGVFGSEFPCRRMFSLRDARISVAEPISISQSKLRKTHPPRENPEPECVCVCQEVLKCIVGREEVSLTSWRVFIRLWSSVFVPVSC